MSIKLQFMAFCAICFLLMCETGEIILKASNNKITRRCSKCPPGWGAVKKCTTLTDTKCIKCIHGKSYSPHHSSKSPCWLCSQCGIGLYESHTCSPVKDTICSECVSYLDHKNLTKSKHFLDKCAYLFLK